jgi:RNA polymerase sigma factor (sigma-70 family)
LEDSFIIRQVLAGNTNAFRFLVLRYQKTLFRYLQSFGLPLAQIEEIAQDSLVKAFKSLSDYDEKQSQFNTWLFTIAKRSALNAISKHGYRKEIFSEEEPEGEHDDTPLSQLEGVFLKKNLADAISLLPISFRNVVTLFHLNEMTLEEISQIEACSLGTVKSRLHRAKAMLREIILKNSKSEAL